MRATPDSVSITDGTKGGTSSAATTAYNITSTGLRIENQTSGNGTRMYNLGGSFTASAEL